MPLRLECPICEFQFQIAQESPPAISVCPECKRSFSTSTALVATESKPKREKLILPEQVLSIPAASARPAPRDPLNDPVVPPQRQETTTDTDIPVKLKRRTYAKPPGKALALATIAILFAIAAGLLIYLPIVINRSNMPIDIAARPTADQGDAPVDSHPSNPDRQAAQWNEGGNDTNPDSAAFANRPGRIVDVENNLLAPKRNPKPAPEPNAEFFSAVQLEDCWREHHSRIVRLKISNSLGEKLALGTIVDSRGWIVTSYRAIVGALQIRVTQSASSFEQFKNEEPLSDLVRGVLAVDVQHDLAILSINRRFVVNFSDLNHSTEDSVAAGDHLAQFGLIDDDTPLFIRETQVTGRPASTDLAPEIAKYLADSAMNSESMKLIAHSNNLGNVGGAPLLTIEGELVGMCTEVGEGNIGCAVSVTALEGLLKSIETDATTDRGNKPLDLTVLHGQAETTGQPNLQPAISVDVDSAYREMSVKLNQIGEQCSEFEWNPTQLDQYQLLQEFARQLVMINTTILEISDDRDLPDASTNLANRTTLQEQANRWTAQMMSSLAPQPLPLSQVEQFNQVAVQAVHSANIDESPTTYVVAYVRVLLGAMDSPRQAEGVETITLDVAQTGDIVIVPFEASRPPMRPESLWLAIYSLNSTRKINFVDPDTGEKKVAYAGEIAIAQGPLD